MSWEASHPRARPESWSSPYPQAEHGAWHVVGAEYLPAAAEWKEGSTLDPLLAGLSSSPRHVPEIDFPLYHRPILSSRREGVAAVVGEGHSGHPVWVAYDS